MHPQHELDHINAVFHQNYRDAWLDNCLRSAQSRQSHRIAIIAKDAHRWTGAMLIAVGDRMQAQSITEPVNVTGGKAESTGA